MGGGWRLCLHHPWWSRHRPPDAHPQCSWIQVKSYMSLKENTHKSLHMYTIYPSWKSWINLFPQAASVHGWGQREEWTISHHLRLWDPMCSRLQVIFPGGEGKCFIYSQLHALGCYLLRSKAWHQYEHIWTGVYFSLQGYNQWNNAVVEQWKGSNRKQSYSYLIQRNSTVGFTWTFQRTEEFNVVRHNQTSWTSTLICDLLTASLRQP